MSIPFLEVFFRSIEPDHVISTEVHFAGLILYSVLLAIYLVFLYQVRKSFIRSGSWDEGWLGKMFFLSVVGLTLLVLSFVLPKLVFYYSGGTLTFMYQEKGIFAAVGMTLFFIFFPACGLLIVNLSEQRKQLGFTILRSVAVVGVVAVLTTLLGIYQIININLNLSIIVLGVLLFVLLLSTVFILLVESKNSFSKVNQLRLRILTFGLVLFLFDLFSILVNFVTQQVDFNLFLFWYNIIQPVQRLITFTLTISCLYLSFFCPLWLQKRFGVLPPSFSKLVEKRNRMAVC